MRHCLPFDNMPCSRRFEAMGVGLLVNSSMNYRIIRDVIP